MEILPKPSREGNKFPAPWTRRPAFNSEESHLAFDTGGNKQ
jgi:hypothetical protein